MPRSTKPPATPGPEANLPENHGLPALNPAVVEQEKGDGLDNIVPMAGYAKLPVVALGGSAGGLAALQAFFGAASPDSGMAFVVILHLSPEHDSLLAEVLQQATSMPVRQVRDRTKVEPNQVYVIPPARHLSMQDGYLCLTEPARAAPASTSRWTCSFARSPIPAARTRRRSCSPGRTATGRWASRSAAG